MFEFIIKIIENNNLIPAWNELPDIKEVLHLENNSPNIKVKDEIKLYEKQGKIGIKMRRGEKFFLEIELLVPESYPFDAPTLKIIDSS